MIRTSRGNLPRASKIFLSGDTTYARSERKSPTHPHNGKWGGYLRAEIAADSPQFHKTIDLKESALYKYFPRAFSLLLADKTTGRNIIWATRDYENLPDGYLKLYPRGEKDELAAADVIQDFIKPRCVKSFAQQRSRTRERAEVFTPSWVCNAQNNLLDEAWFGQKRVFNKEKPKAWTTVPARSKILDSRGRIVFPPNKTWRDYVALVRMEIACGEAPYLVSRYDSTKASRTTMPLSRRIGLLDRKLRVVSENTGTTEEFFAWTKCAFQNVYAFEFQGDSLLLARENLLFSFYDYFFAKFGHIPEPEQMAEIAEIIAWNIFQMDAMTCAVPFSSAEDDLINGKSSLCLVKDWATRETKKFKELLRK